jgi:hypothetical protein
MHVHEQDSRVVVIHLSTRIPLEPIHRIRIQEGIKRVQNTISINLPYFGQLPG